MQQGLRPLPPDTRDLPLGGVFRAVPVESVPLIDFIVSSPLVMKNQGDTDMCTAYTVTEVSEDQEGIELSPEFQFAKIKEITGNIDEWGADLRTACKSAVDIGSLQQDYADKYMEHARMDKGDRNTVADWTRWSRALDAIARQYKKSAYFSVEPGYSSVFDAIRSALWTHRTEKRSIAVGAKWREEWTNAPYGVIPLVYGDDGFGHAFKICGQKMIDGQPYLIAQLSNGTDIGDVGMFYFPKEVVDKEFKYGAFMFKDIAPEVAREHMCKGTKADDPWYVKIYKKLFGTI